MSFGRVAWALFRCHYKHSPAPLTGLPLSNTKEADMPYGAHGLGREKNKTKKKTQKLMIGAAYRPKQQAAADAALYVEIHAITQNKLSVTKGDFNCPQVKWNTMNGDQKGNRMLEMLERAV